MGHVTQAAYENESRHEGVSQISQANESYDYD